jgi:hypothetical protein
MPMHLFPTNAFAKTLLATLKELKVDPEPALIEKINTDFLAHMEEFLKRDEVRRMVSEYFSGRAKEFLASSDDEQTP